MQQQNTGACSVAHCTVSHKQATFFLNPSEKHVIMFTTTRFPTDACPNLRRIMINSPIILSLNFCQKRLLLLKSNLRSTYSQASSHKNHQKAQIMSQFTTASTVCHTVIEYSFETYLTLNMQNCCLPKRPKLSAHEHFPSPIKQSQCSLHSIHCHSSNFNYSPKLREIPSNHKI